MLQPVADIQAIDPSKATEVQHTLGHALNSPVKQRRADSLLWQMESKRQRRRTEADKLADLTGIPRETAQSIIDAMGSVDSALQHPMFQPKPRTAMGSFKQTLRCQVEVINLDELDDAAAHE